MQRRDAASVHRDPRPDQQHRCADGADKISQERADKEEQGVSYRAARRFDAQMNSTSDNEERTDYDHEGQVIDSRVNDPRRLLNDEEIIQTNYAGESDAKLVVVTFPMMLSDERNERDRHQQGHKRHNDPTTRACCDETQDPIHLAIGLIAVRSVNETRLCCGT